MARDVDVGVLLSAAVEAMMAVAIRNADQMRTLIQN